MGATGRIDLLFMGATFTFTHLFAGRFPHGCHMGATFTITQLLSFMGMGMGACMGARGCHVHNCKDAPPLRYVFTNERATTAISVGARMRSSPGKDWVWNSKGKP